MNQPRWSWSEPSPAVVAAFLARQAGAKYSYAEQGLSEAGAPAGYDLDHNRVRVGDGQDDFAAACAALREWRMFPTPWTRIEPAGAPIRVGQTVAMVAHAFGWWVNAARIVYVFDHAAPTRRFGFAYGTLPAHVEQGEERFMVEMMADGTVWFDLRAFSRPRHPLVALARPLARTLQRRFVRESQAAMQQAVGDRAEASR